MLINGRTLALTLGGLAFLTSNALWAQCSGGGGGGSGRSGFSLPTTSNASGGIPFNTVNSNQAAFQVALASQRQQLEVMYRQMMIQQNQIAAMQQQLVMERAAQSRARQQEMLAARKERTKEKEAQKASKLVSAKSNSET
jgi:hypothetical protein